MNPLTLIYGLLIGLVTASLGAWKDTLFEPFDAAKFIRSPLITWIWYLVLLVIVQGSIILVLLSSVTLERFTVESYKALVRVRPGKFKRRQRDWGWIWEKVRA